MIGYRRACGPFGLQSDLLRLQLLFTASLAHQRGNRHSSSMVERPLCDREVAGSIPSRVIPNTFKMVLAALSLGAQHYESRARTGQLRVSIM